MYNVLYVYFSLLHYITIIICKIFVPYKCMAIKTYRSELQALLSTWDHPTVQIIIIFLVFLHTVHTTVIFCWLPSHMGISGNDVSNCFISYTDTYQYISQNQNTLHKTVNGDRVQHQENHN